MTNGKGGHTVDRSLDEQKHNDRLPSPRGSACHSSSGAADSSVQVGSARGDVARDPSGRGHVGGAPRHGPVPSMGGDRTSGGSKAPMLHEQLASISLEVQGAAEVKKVFWIVVMRMGTVAAADVDLFNDFFISSTNDPLSNAGWWINEWDAEVQYSNWDDKSLAFVR